MDVPTEKKKKRKLLSRVKSFLKARKKTRDTEYSKRSLTKIIDNAIAMMWCSYLLAWFEKEEIAETLSKTIASVVIGVVIPYFISKTVENVNKYGSMLNGTAIPYVKNDIADINTSENIDIDC